MVPRGTRAGMSDQRDRRKWPATHTGSTRRMALIITLAFLLVSLEVLSASAFKNASLATTPTQAGYPPPAATLPGYPAPGLTGTATRVVATLTPSISATRPTGEVTASPTLSSPTSAITGTVSGPLVPLGTVTMVFPTVKPTYRPKVGGRVAVQPEESTGFIKPWLQNLARIGLVIVVGLLWIMLGGWIVILIRWARL